LNHSCAPNCSVLHNEKRTALSKISIIAKRAIAPGEELTVTYVNPELPYRSRQDELQAWGFGSCKCDRCVGEEKTSKLNEVLEDGQPDMHDLERELKAGLGVM
jgi:SET domain-containing protein